MVAVLAAEFLAITLLCLPTVFVHGNQAALQMGISSAAVVFILLVPLALVTKECQSGNCHCAQRVSYHRQGRFQCVRRARHRRPHYNYDALPAGFEQGVSVLGVRAFSAAF